MFKKTSLAVFVFLLFFGRMASASIVFSEIQLGPTEDRFIEIYNNGGATQDLTDFYIQRKTASGSSFGSLVTKTSFEGKSIGAGKYFVIARSGSRSADIYIPDLTLTDSNAIQIKNSEGEVVDKVGWGDSSECSSLCSVNSPEGKSMQKGSGSRWFVSSPTPNSENREEATDSSESDENDENIQGENNNVTANSQTSSKTKISDSSSSSPKIELSASSPIFSGVPMEFSVKNSNSPNYCKRYFWNFGDGNSEEEKIRTSKTAIQHFHTYLYEGEYFVFLECYKDVFSLEPVASDKIKISVSKPEIYISKTGSVQDFFVEISNNTSSEVDVSKWVLTANASSFTLPRNFIIAPKGKVILASSVTGFTYTENMLVRLLSPNGVLISEYPPKNYLEKNNEIAVSRVKEYSYKESTDILSRVEESQEENETGENVLANNIDLSAKAIKNENLFFDNSLYFLLGIFIFSGAVGWGVFYLRNSFAKKYRKLEPGEDFDIIEG